MCIHNTQCVCIYIYTKCIQLLLLAYFSVSDSSRFISPVLGAKVSPTEDGVAKVERIPVHLELSRIRWVNKTHGIPW